MDEFMINFRLKLLSNTRLLVMNNKEKEKELYDILKIKLDLLETLNRILELLDYNAENFNDNEIMLILSTLKLNMEDFGKAEDSKLEEEKYKMVKLLDTLESLILSKSDLREFLINNNIGNKEFYDYIDKTKRKGKTKLFIKEKNNVLEDLFISFDEEITKQNKLDEIKCYVKASYLYDKINKEVNLDFNFDTEIELLQNEYLKKSGLIIEEKNKTFKKI